MKEDFVATASNKSTLRERLSDCGLANLLDASLGPRKRCELLAQADGAKSLLVNEIGQRHMLASIQGSIPSYISGLRCWAAFNDSLGRAQHLPVTEGSAIQFAAAFQSAATYEQYLKHLRFAHRLLRLDNSWYTEAVVQVKRGAAKLNGQVRKKVALHSKEVRSMIRLAMEIDFELAALMAVSRLFLFRVPSEALPLQWCGDHSTVELSEATAKITLTKRKNVKVPSALVRECCCLTSGNTLCAVHWLHKLKARAPESDKVFTLSLHHVRHRLRDFAREAGITEWRSVCTHSFRRGVAQDIVDTGCPLAVLLSAGGWSSAAYTEYLRQDQGCEAAVGQAVIMLSDSEDEA